MKIENKIRELIELITFYLSKDATTEQLQEFAWQMIDYFTFTEEKALPSEVEGEKEFWYAIWLIQHLADEEHEKNGITERSLKDALDYLKKIKKIPINFKGERP